MCTVVLKIGKQGVAFHVNERGKYPTWRDPSEPVITELDADHWRVETVIRLGLRYGSNFLRKRVLAEARKTHPDTPNNASIVFAATIGFDYKVLDNEPHRESRLSCPEFWVGIGGRTAYWRGSNHPNKRRLQRLVESCAFGLGYCDRIAGCFEEFQYDGSTDLERAANAPDIDDYLAKILHALADPPTQAPAFPGAFQAYLIENRRRCGYEPDEWDYEHITSEALEVLATLSLDPEEKSLRWSTYPAEMACTLRVRTLSDVIQGALSSEVDAFVGQNLYFADVIADYRAELLTPKTMLLQCVPLYASAFELVDVTMSGRSTRGCDMSISHEVSRDLDDELRNYGAEDKEDEVIEVIDSIMSNVEDAVGVVMSYFASKIDDHASYLRSDDGIWESIEGANNFDEDFYRFINHD